MNITLNKLHWILLGALAAAVPASASAQTVTINFTTTKTATPTYTPNNVLAVWIEKAAGGYVRTVAEFGQTRIANLAVWSTASAKNTTDAITGASQNSLGARTYIWNVRDVNKAVVPNGNYLVKMELSDHNNGSAANNNEASFPITVGTTKVTTTPANLGGFTNVSIVFDPAAMPDLGTTPTPDMSVATSPDLSMPIDGSMGTGCTMAPTPAASGAVAWSGIGLGLGLLALGRRRRRVRA
jgi:hypothetical protein